MAKTVRLPIQIDTGKKTYAPGEPVPLSKDFSQKDADAIIGLHGVAPLRQVDEPGSASPVEIKVADLDDPAVKDAIGAAVAEKLEAAQKAWAAFTSLPTDADDEASAKAVAHVSEALGIEAPPVK